MNRILSIVKKLILLCVAGVVCYLGVLLGILFWVFEIKLQRRPAYIYAAPTVVRVGDDIDAIRLEERLTRLGQLQTDIVLNAPGQWNRSGSTLNMYLKDCPIQGQGIATGPVSIALDWNKVRSIRLLRAQEETAQLVLEPELLHVASVDGTAALCRPVSIDEVPQLLIDAIILTEDPSFFTHAGIDLVSTHRAFITNLKAGRYVQGGSTISQQLVKMSVLSPEKTLWRKTNEIILALAADAVYSKKTILQHYLNRVYFGQWGVYPLHGVAEAARHLFGKSLQTLNVSECALLAASIRAPNVINIHRHPERARARRNMVLGLLFKAGKISRDTYEEAMESPLRTLRPGNAPVKVESFVELVKNRLASLGYVGTQSGLEVVTSLDPLVQTDADAALRKLGEGAGKAFLILVSPITGDVRAFVAPPVKKWDGAGGNVQTFLPVTLLPGLGKDKNNPPKYTLTSQVHVPDKKPGVITIRKAFHDSEPTLAQQLAHTVGAEPMAQALRKFGISASVRGDQVVLDKKVSPLEVLRIYAAMALLGHSPPFRVAKNLPIQTSAKEKISHADRQTDRAAIFLINYMLKDFSEVPKTERLEEQVAGVPSIYSSTDDEGKWFVAYRNDAALLIRMPAAKLRPYALNSLAKKLFPPPNRLEIEQNKVPEGIVFRNICLDSGLLATSTCPRVVKEAFLKGTPPTEWCSMWHETKPMPSNAKKE